MRWMASRPASFGCYPTPQAARQEREQTRVVLALVLLDVEAVPFPRVVERLHWRPGFDQGPFHHAGVLDGRTLILAPGSQEHGHLDLVRHARRGYRIELLALA